ncbi:MAG: squalene/phytoene synthase family protein [Burkholderiales bacterium]|nr:squalene/phytoene synthase family protein [Anaerolineae bacterium]
MNLRIEQTWEYRLLSWAHEALENSATVQPRGALHHASADSLAMAYQYCAAITKHNSRTFYLASELLPEPKRQAVRALYAFCRITDDIVDNSHSVEVGQIALEKWRVLLQSTHRSLSEPVALAWGDTQARFNIPHGYAEQLINGVARDLRQTRYETFDELAEYSYGVASTVGLMAMHIIGFTGSDALPYAVKLGVALQLTNILRDVGEDWRAGRVYLPQAELREFGISETDIANCNVNERWREFMRFQIARNRQLYAEAWPGIIMLNPDGRFAIRAAAELYQEILNDIEAHSGDVFRRRAYVSKWGKLRRLPGIWLHANYGFSRQLEA